VKRWIPRLVVILLLAGGVTALALTQPWAKGDPDITFSTVPVGKGAIQAQVTANGTLSARTTVQVGAQVSGRVMALPVEALRNHLTVLEGGWKREEARVEAIAFLDEAEASALAIIDAIAGLPVPSVFAINEAGKLAHRARLARNEIVALTTPEPAA